MAGGYSGRRPADGSEGRTKNRVCALHTIRIRTADFRGEQLAVGKIDILDCGFIRDSCDDIGLAVPTKLHAYDRTELTVSHSRTESR